MPDPLTTEQQRRLNDMCTVANQVLLGDRLAALEVKTASGSGWITDLAAGATVQVTIDHSAQYDFCLAGVPRFAVEPNLTLRIVLDGTTGSQFVVEFERALGAGGADYGYGGGEADFHYEWTRAGRVGDC